MGLLDKSTPHTLLRWAGFAFLMLLYFVVLFTITMKRQIEHMVKHSYIPCDCFKKKRYKGKHKIVQKKAKAKAVPQMPKVRQPIRKIPASAGMKKVNRD